MDMAFLDVTDVRGVAAGDAVTLIGADGEERITADELGKACGTIGYEIVARLPAHVPRTYDPASAANASARSSVPS
jgi:alanine racemase